MSYEEYLQIDSSIPATGHPSYLYSRWEAVADLEVQTFETTGKYVPLRTYRDVLIFVRHSNGMTLWHVDDSGDSRMHRRYDNES